MRQYGKCVIIEGITSEPEIIDDVLVLMWFTEHIVGEIEMTLLEPPRPVRSKGLPPWNGWTVSAAMEESTVAIHAFPSMEYIRLMIDSCKDFDHTSVLGVFKKIFKVGPAKTHIIKTGGL